MTTTNEIRIQNFKITSATIEFDRGHLTSYLRLEADCALNGFGGYDLSLSNKLTQWVRGCMQALGVDEWTMLTGEICRAKVTGRASATKVVAIGHPLKEQWFSPEDMEDEFKSLTDGECRRLANTLALHSPDAVIAAGVRAQRALDSMRGAKAADR